MSSNAASTDLAPAAIRALRGSESRAVFARRLGVTPHTVYRWELPDGADEARRPRGPMLARLRELTGGNGAATAPMTSADSEALSAAVAAFARLVQGGWREAEP